MSEMNEKSEMSEKSELIDTLESLLGNNIPDVSAIKQVITTTLNNQFGVSAEDSNFLNPEEYSQTVCDIAIMEDDFDAAINNGDELDEDDIAKYINLNADMCVTSYVCDHVGLDDVALIAFMEGLYAYLTGEVVDDLTKEMADVVNDHGEAINTKRVRVIKHIQEVYPEFSKTVLALYINEEE